MEAVGKQTRHKRGSERSSTPIAYFIKYATPEVRARYLAWVSSVSESRHPDESFAALARKVLGAESWCRIYPDSQNTPYKCWAWERPTWRLFASRQGLLVAVVRPDEFNWNPRSPAVSQALDDFLAAWEKGINNDKPC